MTKKKPVVKDVADDAKEQKLLQSLYAKSLELKIIPPDFPYEFFQKNFFYLLIERKFKHDYTGHKFTEYAFGKDYYQSMLQAFQFVFENARSRPLDIDVIHELYLIASNKAIADDIRSYRVDGCSTGFMHFEASKKYFNVEVDLEPTLNLLPDISFGSYYFKKENSLAEIGDHSILHIRCDIQAASEEKIKDDVKALLSEYNSRMQQIKTQDFPDEAQREEKKLELISIFINDFVRYHPYRDGNGRLSCFLLLNYLLISENLTPAMVFNPWQISYSTAEELPTLVKEAQLAYETFFTGAQKITEDDLDFPLIEEITDFYGFEEIEVGAIVLTISEIISCSWQIAAIGDTRGEELQKRKAHLIQLVEEDKLYLEESDWDEISSHQLPIASDGWIEDMILRGLIGLFSEDFLYEEGFDYDDLRQELTDAGIFDDEILDKKEALEMQDYQKIHQAIVKKFPERKEICDKYFEQVFALLARIGEEVTFKEAVEFSEKISEQKAEDSLAPESLDEANSLVQPREVKALKDEKSFLQGL